MDCELVNQSLIQMKAYADEIQSENPEISKAINVLIGCIEEMQDIGHLTANRLDNIIEKFNAYK